VDRLAADLLTGLDMGIPDVELSASPAAESLNIPLPYLYERIMRHIPDIKVRSLARCGCLVRRVTAEVIQQVLQPALEGGLVMDVHDDRRAQELFDAFPQEAWLIPQEPFVPLELFDALSREVWLVSRNTDGSLTLRPDIRRALLPGLRERPFAKVIDSAAVAYYQTRSDITSRAEELYHRLYLRDSPESLDQRWQPGVEPYLATALDEELPVESQLYLASRLNATLPSEVLKKAILREDERQPQAATYPDTLPRAHGRPPT